MRKFYLLICVMAVVLVSCQKEESIDTLGGAGGNGNGSGNGSGSGSGTEVGTWKFISLQASTKSIVEMSAAGQLIKTVTLSDYTTLQNEGTVQFDGKNMTSTNLAYAVDDTAKTDYYINGALDNSFEFPLIVTLPPTSQSAGYKKIGTDSLYFASGVLTEVNSSGTVQSRPAGYKLKFDGDKMMMLLNFTEVRTQTVQGVLQKITSSASVVTTLQKQ